MAKIVTPLLTISPLELWRDNNGGGWFTIAAISFIFIYHLLFNFLLPFFRSSIARFNPNSSSISPLSISSNDHVDDNSLSSFRTSELVSNGDLRYLIDNLDEKVSETETWDNVIEKSNGSVFYKAKCCRPKRPATEFVYLFLFEDILAAKNILPHDGPLKYLSLTVFENCSPEILRDFYMDCEYRKQWDKTVIAHDQLQIDKKSGVEVGRTIKKFPLLTPREYVLAWKIWEGINKTFYCFTKECEHPLAPRQRKYVRAAIFRSGWRIRQGKCTPKVLFIFAIIPGRNACEIKMVHQEDAGLNVEMAKLAFAKGIWNYVCKMDDALRKYALSNHRLSTSAITAVSFMQKVPPELDTISGAGLLDVTSSSSKAISVEPQGGGAKLQKVCRKPTKKMVANGLLLLGSLICLSHGNTSLGAKVAVSFVLKKLCKRGQSSSQNQPR
ncbi:hypothetical protein KSS87_007188 [Heliosperma pusillum]|nr:hypothetical protein KSS87_007188 [Heliosperma pusillum]